MATSVPVSGRISDPISVTGNSVIAGIQFAAGDDKVSLGIEQSVNGTNWTVKDTVRVTSPFVNVLISNVAKDLQLRFVVTGGEFVSIDYVEGFNGGGSGGGVTEAQVQSMINSALTPYITAASVNNLLTGYLKLQSDSTQLINSDIAIAFRKHLLFRDWNNTTDYAGLFLAGYPKNVPDNEITSVQFELGSERIPLCLNHDMLNPITNEVGNKHILVNYFDEAQNQIVDYVKYMSDNTIATAHGDLSQENSFIELEFEGIKGKVTNDSNNFITMEFTSDTPITPVDFYRVAYGTNTYTSSRLEGQTLSTTPVALAPLTKGAQFLVWIFITTSDHKYVIEAEADSALLRCSGSVTKQY